LWISQPYLIPVLVSLQTLNSATANLLECITHLSYADNKFNEFCEMLHKLELVNLPDKAPLPGTWSITHIDIERSGSSRVTCRPELLPLRVEP
jgi:hypothetical protein